MYIYPDNLRASATLGLWKLKDIAVIVVCALFSIMALVVLKFSIPLVITAVYAFLSIRYEDISVKDFLKYACGYFISQQYFEWRESR